jgi:spermidine synthase
LGGGDGLALREILKYNDVLKVTLVDIDPAIVETASELDFMRDLNERAFDDPRVKVIIDDAFKFLEQQKRRQNSDVYDLIFIDLPDPTDDSLARLYSKEFYLMLKTVVAPGTLVTIQSGGYMTPIQKTIILTLESAGFKTLAFQPPYFSFLDQNFGFTLASLNDLSIQEIQGASLKAPTMVLKNYSLSQIFASALHSEISPFTQSNIKVNSIFRPSLIQFQITTFAEHYLESQPKEKILSQIKLPEEEIIRQFQKIILSS